MANYIIITMINSRLREYLIKRTRLTLDDNEFDHGENFMMNKSVDITIIITLCAAPR